MAPKEASAFDESDDETTMVQKNTWRTAARKCVYQDQLWRGAVGKILSVVSGPPILKLALLLKLFLMMVYQFKDIGIEHIFNGSRLKPIMRYVFWLILDERYWLEKKHSFPQGESLSCEAEDLGKTWQSFVAENALRARDCEQVANFEKNSRHLLTKHSTSEKIQM